MGNEVNLEARQKLREAIMARMLDQTSPFMLRDVSSFQDRGLAAEIATNLVASGDMTRTKMRDATFYEWINT